MALRALLLALAVAAAATPLAPAFAQGGGDWTQQLATELAVRRAQVRSAYCRTHQTVIPSKQLPTSPAVGSGHSVKARVCTG